MISVIIPTLNAERTLAPALAALVPAAVEGLVREVVIVDGGSTDRTAEIIDQSGARTISKSGGRGYQLAAGARVTTQPWLLFLHADTVLEPGWEREAGQFVEQVESKRRPASGAVFRFALDDIGAGPRLLERAVAARCAVLRLPYGDQGLLMPRTLYDEIGGFRPFPLMEDVDIIRRLGRRRIAVLHPRAITSAERYRESGYMRRSARNLLCLGLYAARVPVSTLARLYSGEAKAGSDAAGSKGIKIA